MTPSHLSATEAAAQIRQGTLSSVDLTKSCLARIAETDALIGAWAYLDADQALAQAAALDQHRADGQPLGPLHGVPVGIKDIFDTADMPTALGSTAHPDRRPDTDSAAVEKLRAAGAVILGKTVTTPLAFVSPSKTRNPHNPDYSPGGSSSGSAAGVAAGHMPLAIGSQTGGSVNRPASFCGVYGFKPTRGQISRRGALQTSETLDCVGGFARTLEDVALLNDALTGYDPADSASHDRPRPQTRAGCRAEPPSTPKIAFIDFPPFNMTEPMRDVIEEVAGTLGPHLTRLPTPDCFADFLAGQHTIHTCEIARNLHGDPAIDPEHTDDLVRDLLAQGRAVTEDAYAAARANVAKAESFFAAFFQDYDALLCPASCGEAPLLSENTTGDAVCQKIFTFAGVPTLTLPMYFSKNDLPLGVQLVGAAEGDDRLFRTAQWLMTHWSQAGMGPIPKGTA